jgi:L-fucose/D-arabinose isomerase
LATIAVVTVSDGREPILRELIPHASSVESAVAIALEAKGHRVLRAEEIVSTNELAVAEARRLASQRPDVALVNIPTWAYPQFTMLLAQELACPLILFSNVDPKYPGMVGMLAASGALDQIGRRHFRAWGDISEPSVSAEIDGFAAAAAAVHSLRGSTFGRFGGRPMGMYTAVANPDDWLAKFGIDVEEIDQWELVRRADAVSPTRASSGREWLERKAAGVHYDGARLTPELLERQIRCYHAMTELIEEHGLDFCGIKGQPELTDHFCTMDIAEAFLNDPYDWEGKKTPVICSTEADMDGALTMQILHQLSKTPVLFADLRYFHADLGIWDLCNSGQHATWFSARSDDPAENLSGVHLYPEEFYFPAGGAAVHHLAAPGEFTFARLTRLSGQYRMQVLRGQLEQFDSETNEQLMKATTYVWPHAFARFEASELEVFQRYACNHIHAIPGDHVDALKAICQLLDVQFDGFGSLAAGT